MASRLHLLLVAAVAAGCPTAAPAPTTNSATRPAAAPRLGEWEGVILEETNRVRRDPRAYAQVLQRQLPLYDGRLLQLPGETPILTQEGGSAVKGAIRALLRARPAPALLPSRGMSRAAADHVGDLGPSGRTSHTGRDGSDPFVRLERHGSWLGSAAENIHYGAPTPRQVVIQLLIDDAVPSRGHRKNILNPRFRVTGIACGKHRSLRKVCVITYAEGYNEGPP